MNQRTRRRGFTLPEVLVTIALLSLLAAVVIPSVVGQITSGETSKVEQNLLAIRSGVEQFASDVHRYPRDVGQLLRPLVTADSDVFSITPYPTPLSSRWRGPYVHRDSVSLFLASGFGAGGTISNAFKIETTTAGIQYISVVVTGLRTEDKKRIDLDLDATSDTANGMVRYRTESGKDSLVFRLIPIQ